MNKIKKISILGAGALALAFYILNTGTDNSENKIRSVSSIVEPMIPKQVKSELNQPEQKNKEAVKAALIKKEKVAAPAPYFINSENFKTYDKILYKAVRSQKEKQDFKLSLLDHRNLEDVAKYLKSPSDSPGKEEKIYHMKASGFLIKAISEHPAEFEVTTAVKEVLAVNLSEAQKNLSLEAYTLLKENKAELMYHALAVSYEIKSSYKTDKTDVQSAALLKKVQDLHARNIEQSKKMIADR